MNHVALLLLFSSVMTAASPVRNIIIDTDAGSDDLMAIAFLLARKDIHIEAITVVNGLAHVPAGAKNILRLLELAQRRDIPVYEGRATPLEGANEFPDSWRAIADALPSVTLPETELSVQPVSAFAFLRGRLSDSRRPVSILALGPLTNLAEVLNAAPKSAFAIDDLVIMGGAVRVPGNLTAGGINFSDNRTAEWNIYIDPVAAGKVIQTVERCRLIPLDACNTVPLDTAFLAEMIKTAKSKLGQFAAQVLASNRVLMADHLFFAWDPLAAVASLNPAVVKISSVQLDIVRTAPDQGRTLESPTGRPVRAALSANPSMFRKIYIDSLR